MAWHTGHDEVCLGIGNDEGRKIVENVGGWILAATRSHDARDSRTRRFRERTHTYLKFEHGRGRHLDERVRRRRVRKCPTRFLEGCRRRTIFIRVTFSSNPSPPPSHTSTDRVRCSRRARSMGRAPVGVRHRRTMPTPHQKPEVPPPPVAA